MNPVRSTRSRATVETPEVPRTEVARSDAVASVADRTSLGPVVAQPQGVGARGLAVLSGIFALSVAAAIIGSSAHRERLGATLSNMSHSTSESLQTFFFTEEEREAQKHAIEQQREARKQAIEQQAEAQKREIEQYRRLKSTRPGMFSFTEEEREAQKRQTEHQRQAQKRQTEQQQMRRSEQMRSLRSGLEWLGKAISKRVE
jgi:flagellar biosynthesis GTPase FlhF